MTKDGGIALKRLKMDQIGLKIDPKGLNLDETGLRIVFVYKSTCFLADFFCHWLGLVRGTWSCSWQEIMTRGRLKLCSTPPIHLLFKACLNYVLCLPYVIYASIQCQDFVGNLLRITISIFPISQTFTFLLFAPILCFEAEDQSSCDKKTPKSKSGIRYALVDWSCSEYKVSGPFLGQTEPDLL